MTGKLSIGTVAKMKGISVKMLRHYDEIGLLKPMYVDPFTGYRYYGSSQLLFIEFITFFRKGGASLDEIAEACKDDDALAIADFSVKQIERVNKEIENLKEAITSYKGLCRKIYNDAAHAKNQGLYWQRIQKRIVVMHDVSNKIITGDDVYDHYWELYKEIRISGLRTLYATGATVVIPEHRGTAELIYKEIYCEAKICKDSLSTTLKTIPEGEYLCVNYHRNNKKMQLDLLKDFLDEIGKEPKICIELDTFTCVTQWEDPLYEMQVLF